MDFYLRAYTDAGSLLSTPLTITRATGAAAFISTISATGATLTSTQTNLVLNTTTNTSFSKLSFQDNGVEKGTLTYANSAFAATSRRDKLEIANTGGINFITQNAPLTPDMVITSSGNVSIGNTNNTFKLDVSGTGRFTGALTALQGIFRNSGVPAIQAIRDLNVVTAGSAGQGIEFGALNGTTPTAGASIYGTLDNPATTGFLVFQTMTGGSLTTKMTITSAGNVGIGTGSPSEKLDVIGGALAAGNGTIRTGITYSSLGLIGTFTNHDLGIIANGIERMRIESNGDIKIGIGAGIADTKMLMISKGTTSSTFSLVIKQSNASTNLFYVRDDGAFNTGLAASSPYNLTVATSANVFVDSGGFLYRATSSLKYKNNVQDYNKGLNEVMQLRPVTYESKSEIEKGATFAGLIAEEVHDLGLTEFVQYAEDGTPDALSYSNMVSLLVKAIQELKAEIDILKTK